MILNAAKETVSVKKKEKRNEWVTDEILAKMKERKAEKRGFKPYNEIGKEIRKMCNSTKEHSDTENCEKIERLEKEHRPKELH